MMDKMANSFHYLVVIKIKHKIEMVVKIFGFVNASIFKINLSQSGKHILM